MTSSKRFSRCSSGIVGDDRNKPGTEMLNIHLSGACFTLRQCFLKLPLPLSANKLHERALCTYLISSAQRVNWPHQVHAPKRRYKMSPHLFLSKTKIQTHLTTTTNKQSLDESDCWIIKLDHGIVADDCSLKTNRNFDCFKSDILRRRWYFLVYLEICFHFGFKC